MMETAVEPYHRAGVEGLESERVEIELAAHLGVGGEQDLETAIDEKSIDFIGSHAATYTIGRFEYPNAAATLRHGYYTHLPTVDVATVAALDDVELDIPAMWWNSGALFIAKHIALSLKDYNLHQAIVGEMQAERQRLLDNARRSLGPVVPQTRSDG